jgi:hypothetical protein
MNVSLGTATRKFPQVSEDLKRFHGYLQGFHELFVFCECLGGAMKCCQLYCGEKYMPLLVTPLSPRLPFEGAYRFAPIS